jgi:hypothetical protein
MNDYIRSLLRFWWVLVLGVVVASAAATLTVYRIDLSGSSPELVERTQPRYSAQGRLLVTNRSQSHLRVAETSVQAVASGPQGEIRMLPITAAPDNATLVQAANLYPSLIESDEVTKLREEKYGRTQGQLKVQALFAVSTASRFTPSRIPVIQLIGVADSRQAAIDLVANTNKAFIQYVKDSQNRGRIQPDQRIVVLPLQTPTSAVQFGGASSTLPVLAFGVVLMGFAALALFLDRLFPRRSEEVAPPAAETAQERVRTSA